VDEAPEAVKLDTAFGRFEGAAEVKDGKLVVKRKLELKHLEVPAPEYGKLREFLNAVNGHQNAVAVLIRK
jgi:hypothetical protein